MINFEEEQEKDDHITNIDLETKKSKSTSPLCSPLLAIQEDGKESEQWTSLEQRKSALLTSSPKESSKEIQPDQHQESGGTSVEKTRQKFMNKQSGSFDFPHVKKNISEKLKAVNDDDNGDAAPSTTLDINEKSWIIRTAQADLVQMRVLLDLDLSLADKKDFVMNGIHWAAKKGNLNMLNMLLDLKVNVNSKSGYTPLHLAAIYGHERCISVLLDHGADVHARDYSGRKAIDYLTPSESDENYRTKGIPSWKQHYFSGSRPPCVVASDLYNRIQIKIITSKLDNDFMFRSRCENESAVAGGGDRKQRAKSVALGEIPSSFSETSSRSSKITRRDTTRSSWKLPGIRKQKLPSVSDQFLIEHPGSMAAHGKSPVSPSF